MTDKDRFQQIFEELRTILKPYEPHLTLKVDTGDNYYLVAPDSPKWKAEVMFGAVRIKKSYVSYHLMPVYMYPDLLDAISVELKRRMQGKSCFNFSKEDVPLWRELAALTSRGFERFRAENL